MSWLGLVAGLLAFRTSALRALAARQALVVSWLSLAAGCSALGVARAAAFAGHAPGERPPGGVMDLNIVQAVLYLGFLYVPALICLSNAAAGDGLGFSFSRDEYRSHVSVLFPLWGVLLLVGAAAQLAVARTLSIGMLELSVGLLPVAALLAVYTVWSVKQLNYISGLAAAGIVVASVATVPVFFVLTMFVFALPFFLMLPLGWVLWQRIGDVVSTGVRERDLAEHLKTLTINPRDSEAHHQLGLLHLRKHNLEAAQASFEEACRIEPGDPDYHYGLGRVFEERGEWERALEEYAAVFRIQPEYALRDILREVGKSYIHTGEVEKGIEFLRAFLESRGSDPEARYWLAVALGRLERTDEMHAELQSMLDSARANPRFFRKGNRKWLYRARGLLRESGGRGRSRAASARAS